MEVPKNQLLSVSFDVTKLTRGQVSWRNIQLEYGNNVTTYYPRSANKIHLRNTNGSYIEIYNEENPEVYTSYGRRVGTWTDGKPLYCATINVGNMPNATTKTYEHGIANVDHIHIDLGNSYLLEPTNNNNTSPFTNNWDVERTGVYVSKTVIGVNCTTNYSDRVGVFTLKYTLTTD
jgi:hypothetical protein